MLVALNRGDTPSNFALTCREDCDLEPVFSTSDETTALKLERDGDEVKLTLPRHSAVVFNEQLPEEL